MRVITRLNIGGPAVHALLLTREMRAAGYQTVLVAGSCEAGDGDMPHPLQAHDRVNWVPELSRSVRPWRNLKALWRLVRLLRREQPALVHTHTAMAGCIGRVAAVLCGVPIIVHTFHGNCLNEYFSPLRTRLFCRIEQLLARFSDVLCVVSPQQAGELSAKFHLAPAQKFRIVPLGLDLDDYFALDVPGGNGPLTVGWFGRMVPVKNIELLAATIDRALEGSADIRFVIAGDGPEKARLNDVLEWYGGRVEWLGWQTEILPAMARCDVLLQTSRNEGTPVALIQGMAAGRPFVSTAAGGVVDMVSGSAECASDGTRRHANGVLAPPQPGALAGALIALERDRTLVARMGHSARAAAVQYRKERLVADLDALYRELAQKKSRGQTRSGRNS